MSQAEVDCKLPPSCTALEQLRRATGFDHGPHTMVAIRNDLIHQDMSYGILSVDVCRQAKELGLWYVEMLLLKLCKPLDPAMARPSGTYSLGADNCGKSMTTLIEADVEQAARDWLEGLD